ncbi:hypothetical protein [Embleya sp. NPDC005575]|uniref:hypothetical protein n=1 Tax=Embleya sp. NPDC005575 TaxID=3156892 RepID=UPI00339F2B30
MEALRDGDPTRLGPYRLRGRLGEGGMGEVFLGTSPSGVRVAVKTVRAEFTTDHGFRDRFRRETDATGDNAAHLFALRVKTGEPAWQVTLPAPVSSRVVSAKGNVYLGQWQRSDAPKPAASVVAYEG